MLFAFDNARSGNQSERSIIRKAYLSGAFAHRYGSTNGYASTPWRPGFQTKDAISCDRGALALRQQMR